MRTTGRSIIPLVLFLAIVIFNPAIPGSFHREIQDRDGPSSKFLTPPQTSNVSNSSISTGLQLKGLNFTKSLANPPDVQVAAGPNHIVEMVNQIGQIWLRNGTFVKSFKLAPFFGTGTDFIPDPKIMFDSAAGTNGRWFASIADLNQWPNFNRTGIRIAVSANGDPTGTWKVYNLTVSLGANAALPDQPILGLSDDKLVVSANLFAGGVTFLGAKWWAYSKSDLTSFSANPRVQSFGPFPGFASIHPGHSLSSTTTQYLVSAGTVVGQNLTNTTNIVTVFSLKGLPPNAVVTNASLTVRTISMPPPALEQQGSSCINGGGEPCTIDTIDYRVTDVATFDDKLWLGLNDGCVPNGDNQARSCIRLVQVDLSSSSTLQDFDGGNKGSYYFYPALAIDSMGDLDVVYGFSNSTTFPSLAVTGQAINDPSNGLISPTVIHNGIFAVLCGFGPCRYGDYFGAAVDPSDPTIVWVAGEYGEKTSFCLKTSNQNCWATTISEMRVRITVKLDSSATFLGFSIRTTGSVTVDPISTQLTVSGSSTVVATNSSTGVTLFTKTYALTQLPVPPTNVLKFLLNVGVNSCPSYSSTCPLSSNTVITYNGTTAIASVSVTRNVDINHNGVVDTADTTILQAAFGCSAGQSCYNPQADINADGTVDILDASALSNLFGAKDYI